MYLNISTMDFDPHASTVESSSADDIVHEVQNFGIKEESSTNITCFSDVFNDSPIHYQIICFPNRFMHGSVVKLLDLDVCMLLHPQDRITVSVTSLLGGTSDNTGSGIARRTVLKTGVPVTLACNIPKDSPMLEAHVEKKLIQKLIFLGYTKAKPQPATS